MFSKLAGFFSPKSKEAAKPTPAEIAQAESEKQARIQEKIKRNRRNRQSVSKWIAEMPTLLARAEEDESYLKKISGPKTDKFWKALLRDPEYRLPASMHRIEEPHTSAFSLIADRVYYATNFRDRFFFVMLHLMQGLTTAQIGLTQYAGRSSFSLQTKWVENNAVAVKDNLQMGFSRLRDVARYPGAPPAAHELHAILDDYERRVDEMNQLSLEEMQTLQSVVFPKLVHLRDDEINRMTLELDNAIRVTKGFYCMAIRSLLDALMIESARKLLATDPVELPINDIKKRALQVAAKHGAPGLMVCARVYYELSLYCLTQSQYCKKSSQFFQTQIGEYQKKAYRYAGRAMTAAQGAVDSYRNKKNQQRIKNLGFSVGGWSLFCGINNFENFKKEIEEGLAPCLSIANSAAHQRVAVKSSAEEVAADKGFSAS